MTASFNGWVEPISSRTGVRRISTPPARSYYRDSSTPTRMPSLPALVPMSSSGVSKARLTWIFLRAGAAFFQASGRTVAADLRVRFAPKFLEYGTTTIEAKSGYGLNLETEVRMLEAMRATDNLEIVPTYLGAHAIPQEFRDNRNGFIQQITKDLESIHAQHLAEFCDVFVEPGVFTPEEAQSHFSKAKSLGMRDQDSRRRIRIVRRRCTRR